MENYICVTCGVQYEASEAAPEHCPICEDERQYIGHNGQRWTTIPEMKKSYKNRIEDIDPNITGIGTVPSFGIGHRALLVQTPQGNVLWDPVSLVDEATLEAIHARGGLRAIAVSHPHLVGSLVELSQVFDHAPIYWHADNRQWVMRPDPTFVFWQGETCEIKDGVTLIRCGGHFAGGTVLHWAAGGEGCGALLSGDIVQVIPDRNHVSFMRSYPNIIPLSAPAVARIGAALEPFAFDVIYGAFFDRVVPRRGKDAVRSSVKRYIAIVEGDSTAEQI